MNTRSEVRIAYLLLAATALVAVFLGARLHSAGRDQGPDAPPLLAPGDELPGLELTDLSGEPAHLDFEQESTLVYVFSPQCSWCRENLAGFKQVHAAARARLRVVGVSTDPRGLDGYLETAGMDFPVYVAPIETVREFRLMAVPQTLVIAAGGTVQKSWGGAYAGPVKTDVEAYFGITLPEIDTNPPTAVFCHDSQGRPSSVGAIVESEDHPGTFVRCAPSGDWVAYELPRR